MSDCYDLLSLQIMTSLGGGGGGGSEALIRIRSFSPTKVKKVTSARCDKNVSESILYVYVCTHVLEWILFKKI